MNLEELIPPGMTDHRELIVYMADKLRSLYEQRADDFFLLLYRLDIPEEKVFSEAGSFEVLAENIWQRQLQKWESRKAHKGHPPVDEDLRW